MQLHSAMRATIPLIFSMLLAACGGGSGGGSGSSSPASTPTTSDTVNAEPPLSLTPSNVGAASAASLNYGSIVLAFAQSSVDWASSIDKAGVSTLTSPCASGGSQTITLLDNDGNRHVSAGDHMTVTLVKCYVKPLQNTLNGTLTIAFTSPNPPAQQTGIISFGSDFGFHDIAPIVNFSGSLCFDYTVSRPSKVVRAYSGSQAFGISHTYTYTEPLEGGRLGDKLVKVVFNESITKLDAQHEARLDTMRTSTAMRYHLASTLIGGSLDVATTVPWASWFDTYPDAGELTMTGVSGTLAKLRAATSQYNILLNDKIVDVNSNFVRGARYLWSSTGWLAQDNSADYHILDQAENLFRPLLQPDSNMRPIGSLVWLYSKPIDTTRLPTLAFQLKNTIEFIPATLQVEGGMLTATPTTQLHPGSQYDLRWSGDIYDTEGNVPQYPPFSIMSTATVEQTITASANIQGPAILFGTSATLSLDASASSASGFPVASTHWSQISGPPLKFTGADKPTSTVTPTSAENGTAVVEVEVRNSDGEYDRQRISFPVIANISDNSFVVVYRVDTSSLNIQTNAGSEVKPYVKSFQQNTILDVMSNGTSSTGSTTFLRFLASLPGGQTWQDGLDVVYGPLGSGGANVNLIRDSISSCTVSGHFSVLDYAIDNAGNITRLALDFEDTCSSGTTYGSIRYQSSLPLRF